MPSPESKPVHLPRHVRTQLAAAAGCDERTVKTYVDGSRGPQSRAVINAIRAALKKHGIPDPRPEL
jgi:hypothetical protein